MIDEDAVIRNLQHIAARATELAIEIAKCKRGEYSPLMSEERFESVLKDGLAAVGMTRKELCFVGDFPHHCSKCEYFVEAWMNGKIKASEPPACE
jgi:hypothetical protein